MEMKNMSGVTSYLNRICCILSRHKIERSEEFNANVAIYVTFKYPIFSRE
jgi:hypothetical protein